MPPSLLLLPILLLLLLLPPLTHSTPPPACQRPIINPSSYSSHAFCVDRPSLDKCLQHRYVDVFLSLVPVEYPIQTLNLHFSTALLQQNIVVRLVWVDQIGTEVDYFTSTVGQTSYTFSSFASHSWRIYLNDKLTKEIEPDATIQIPTLKMTQHLHRIMGTERFPGVLNYYTTTDFDIDVPLPPCSGGNGTITALAPDSSRTVTYRSVGGQSKTGLSIANDPYHESKGVDNTVPLFLETTAEASRASAALAQAQAHCKEHLSMWSTSVPSAPSTFGSAILYAPLPNSTADNFSMQDMDALVGTVVQAMAPTNRFDYFVTHQLNVPVRMDANHTCVVLGPPSDIVLPLRQALILTNLTFFDVVYIVPVDVAATNNTNAPANTTNKNTTLPYECIPGLVEFLSQHVVVTRLAKSWGFAQRTQHTQRTHRTVHGHHLRRAWSHALLHDHHGPQGGVQQPFSNLGAPRNHSYINPNQWQLLMETNQVGVTAWTASATVLFATYVDPRSIASMQGFPERDVSDHRTCSIKTLNSPYMAVSVRRTSSSATHQDRPNSDVLCGAAGISCTQKDLKYRDARDSSILDWRNRQEPGLRSPLKPEEYRLLKQSSETAWNSSVIWRHPNATVTAGATSLDTTFDSVPVPWTATARRKRFVIDNILSKKECKLLIKVAKKHALSGASYTGIAKKLSAVNKLSAASWGALIADQSTEERKQAATLYSNAVSRIRAAIMNYFNLTDLYISNSALSSRLPGGGGHQTHSDDCIWRPDRQICEPSNKVHECCVNYHYSGILFLTPQGGKEGKEGEEEEGEEEGEEEEEGEDKERTCGTAGEKACRSKSKNTGQHLWKGSRFFWHEQMSETASVKEIETWSYPKRTRVNNRCGRLVGFTAGEENPHGAETIGLGPDAHRETLFEAKPVGDVISEMYEDYENENAVDWSQHARWAMTNWFTTDSRFTQVGNERSARKYTVDPWGESFRGWLRGEGWGEGGEEQV